MTTFANVQKATESRGLIIFNDETPAGHFGARITFKGHPTFYLFQGETGDPEAVIKGRIEYTSEAGKLVRYAFAQGGVTGGTPLGEVTNIPDISAKMV